MARILILRFLMSRGDHRENIYLDVHLRYLRYLGVKQVEKGSRGSAKPAFSSRPLLSSMNPRRKEIPTEKSSALCRISGGAGLSDK